MSRRAQAYVCYTPAAGNKDRGAASPHLLSAGKVRSDVREPGVDAQRLRALDPDALARRVEPLDIGRRRSVVVRARQANDDDGLGALGVDVHQRGAVVERLLLRRAHLGAPWGGCRV